MSILNPISKTLRRLGIRQRMILFWLQETPLDSNERTNLAIQLYLGLNSAEIKRASKSLSKLNLARWNKNNSLVLTKPGRDWLRLVDEDLRPKFSRVYFPNLCLRQRQALRFLSSNRSDGTITARRLGEYLGLDHPMKLINSLLRRRLIFRTTFATYKPTKMGRDWSKFDRERRGLSLIS